MTRLQFYLRQARVFLYNLWQGRWVRRLAYVFLGLIVFTIVMNEWIMPAYTKHGQAMPVPDVTRMRFEDAREILESQNFRIIRSEDRYDSSFPEGYVTEQTPRSGSLVKSGRRIYVILSRGPRRFAMPRLVDRSARNAKLMLAKNGLVMGEKSYEYSNRYPEGVVIHQSIAPGVQVQMGTKVDITLSLGQVPDQFVVPSLEGRTLDDARDLIARSGLKLGLIRYKVVSELLPETVLKQSIEAGTTVGKDEVIDLVVSALSRKNDRSGW